MQTDGLNVYDKVGQQDGVVHLGCNMHSRRRFEEAAVNGAKAGQNLGEEGLKLYEELYETEELIRDKPPDERFRVRNELAAPIFVKLRSLAEASRSKVPIKSKIYGALNYFLTNYEYLTGYLRDGRLEMDNGFTERAIRKFAIGRNNWMFSDTVAGADASSLLYSLVVTAKVNGVNPYAALVTLFTELPKAKTIEDYERLAEVIASSVATVSPKGMMERLHFTRRLGTRPRQSSKQRF